MVPNGLNLKLQNLFTGLNIDSKKRRKALLLHYIGDEVLEIYRKHWILETVIQTTMKPSKGYQAISNRRKTESWSFLNLGILNNNKLNR